MSVQTEWMVRCKRLGVSKERFDRVLKAIRQHGTHRGFPVGQPRTHDDHVIVPSNANGNFVQTQYTLRRTPLRYPIDLEGDMSVHNPKHGIVAQPFFATHILGCAVD